MSQARRRRKQFLAKHPFCCFCGGDTPATTIDHIPSRQMFRLKQRPKGLEFPACATCNRATGSHEQVAAMIARCYPDRTEKKEIVEATQLMRLVRRDTPLLFAELVPSWKQQYDVSQKFGQHFRGGAINASGPLLNRSMRLFGAKLCLALHYENTGKILPKSGGVAVRWFTNWDRATNSIPKGAFLNVGAPKTLEQGAQSVPDQFQYAWACEKNGSFGQYVASFGASFMIAGFLHHDPAILRKAAPAARIVQPGHWDSMDL